MKNEPIQENHQPSYMEIILKTSPTQRFLSFWRNRRNQITVFVGHLSMSLPLEFSNFSKHYDFSNFLQIFWEIAETSEMAVFAGHPSTSSNTCLNFSKKCDLSNFSQFLEKSQNLQKSQFLLGTLLPLLTLVLINFSKNCDFSNFSQVLLLRANLDISHCSTFFSHTCTCKLQEYSKGLDCWLGPVLVFFRVWFEYLISAPSFKKWAPAQRACI